MSLVAGACFVQRYLEGPKGVWFKEGYYNILQSLLAILITKTATFFIMNFKIAIALGYQ